MPSSIERTAWLREKRRLAEERMDTLFAPSYDEYWGATLNSTHQRFIRQLVDLCHLQGSILDATCGTGKYWSIILNVGIDQSQGLLFCTRSKFPQVPVKKIVLQEIRYQRAFDGIMCVDALENVFPEDWPLVLYNFHQALKSQGYLYLTVKLVNNNEIENAYQVGKTLGLPIVWSEWVHEEGYHYYPKLEEVRDWIESMHFTVNAEKTGDGYHHFLIQQK
ncbi:MAG: class I SAM-dependent methyltransferase [Chloroflexi bacterium AL-W]|nr:class I SAM-dependent methyltransferase [Chloroflexi bacterium AL-N1]NOK68841.1 class I SAM-dependent methyltransferase [Chloroflexi bacterium AL-N10]NOK76825.1 class I SAM-dependent methyltransferase [Chloroflexi bacterium AL-N5]NOK82788.1 class I SAM-dependent methyltransferase [Chloroflexi bacterium AL-W]NOK90682.1 class I SAM-dependent methyltransferase [Chloroflexi bacterium AL-N15]